MLKTNNIVRKRQNGDTLIEVLFAITVFSLIVVSSLSIMNQGTAASQRSVEITSVRQQIDAQAETVRFLHDSFVEAYKPGITYNVTDATSTPDEEYYKIIEHIKAHPRSSPSTFGGGGASCVVPNNTTTDFILDPITASFYTASTKPGVFNTATTYAQLTYTPTNTLDKSYGIWVEAIRVGTAGSSAGYIDFHIRACWSTVGISVPMNLGTIVRLYEPRG